MPSKYQEYRQMADTAERQLTSSYKSWTQFLRTAARLYKYPYNEQVMIHAQRPDATACAEYDFWNKKMGRFIRRGSTGIALIDTSGQKPQVHSENLAGSGHAYSRVPDLALHVDPAYFLRAAEYPVCASRPCERFQFHRPQCKKRCDRACSGVSAFALRSADARCVACCTASSAAGLDERKSILVTHSAGG